MLSMIMSAETLGNFAWKLRCGSLANDAVMSPPPMWKLIGTSASCAAAQRRSQCGSESGGSPYESGLVAEIHRLVTVLYAALELRDRKVQIPEWR